MKAKKQDRNLQDLFRHKLENAEIIPDPSVSAMLMRKLAVREFLHFNPLRFNIYYLAGIIGAGIATVIILTSGPVHKNQLQPPDNVREMPLNEKSENISAPVISAPEDNKPLKTVKISGPAAKNIVAGKKDISIKANVQVKDSSRKDVNTPGRVLETIKGKELFNRTSIDNLKLLDSRGEELFESSVHEGCAPLRVVFNSKLTESDSCLWTFGDGGSSVKKEPEWIYDIEGEYKVVLKVYGPDGSLSEYSSLISVFPKPEARFEIVPDRAAIPEDEIRFQNYSAGGMKYLWSFGEGNTSEQFEPVHRYQKYGNYNVSLLVYSEKWCADSLVVYNAFSGSAYFIEFPNAFIPNTGGPSGGVYSSMSDESALVFHPSFSGVAEYHLKIFSKLGVLIFETNDINIGWDGYYKGMLSNPGVYIWKVRGNFSNGEPFTKMGDVTLLKN